MSVLNRPPSKTLKKKADYLIRIAAVVSVCMIIYLSLIPGSMEVRTGAPKTLEHLVAYLLSGLALAQAFAGHRRAPMVIVFLIMLAGSLEVFQYWVPGRTTDVKDWEASSLGSIVGVMLARMWHQKASKYER
jgi:VanZ family protein